ncbi:hypothetical protein [Leisingera aquaemixtae]|uniref:hypothetical protein n=1 Tax=Leisingera aquaemixtae TaxID=1396826 RepID=UPI0021A8B288|nr:hypothetical protein [Leisingera aquaemixtae]UWQ44421.1 hypothetical protein K3719_11480 [Leisingera aquaemixtae]
MIAEIHTRQQDFPLIAAAHVPDIAWHLEERGIECTLKNVMELMIPAIDQAWAGDQGDAIRIRKAFEFAAKYYLPLWECNPSEQLAVTAFFLNVCKPGRSLPKEKLADFMDPRVFSDLEPLMKDHYGAEFTNWLSEQMGEKPKAVV